MRRLTLGALLAATLSAAISLVGMVPAGAATGPVSATPANTPQLYGSDNPVQQVRQLVQCGDTMYAVGTFNEIKKGSTTYARSNIFSFSATAPYNVTSWAPSVNGIVNTIAFSGGNCADAYIGGKFTSVNGTKVANIAEIDTTTGNVVTSFGHTANGQVETLLGVTLGGVSHILAGGYYTTINGSSADKYMTSLNPATGKDDGFLQLNISGNYLFCTPGSKTECATSQNNPTRVYNQQLSPDGTLDLVEGDFTSVGGQARQQIFMLNLTTTPATVTGWTSSQFNGECYYTEPFYIQAAAWSPDQSTIYIATTGYHPNGGPTGKTARTGLCDAAAAFPATQSSVSDIWVNYTGCDSLYAAAADSSTAYFGGHERWSQNPDDCDAAGTGAISAPGMEGLSPATGNLTFNPTRARGLGADDMLLTSAGLWIASDNQNNANQCAGKYGHAGICFLPYS
jgi:hypothetical protein